MIVTSVSHIFDLYNSMFRTTEYKTLEDEQTKKELTSVVERFKLDLYNNKGEIETWNE